MPERACEHCGEPLNGMRPQARFCKPAHRAAASRVKAAERARNYLMSAGPPLVRSSPEKPHVRFVDGYGRVDDARRGGPRTTRLRKAECPGCGCIIRLARKWIRLGLPTCACGCSFVSADDVTGNAGVPTP